MKHIYLLILALAFLAEVSAQTPDWQWAVHGGSALSGPSSVDDDIVSDMVTDDYGNTYVYAQVVQFAQFDTFKMQGFGQMDYALVKYNCEGNIEWARFMGGGQSAFSGGMTLGPDGKVYINGITDAGGGSLNWNLHDTIIYQQFASYFQLGFDAAGNRKRTFFANYLVGSAGLDMTSADEYIYALGRGNGGVFAQGHQIDTGIYIMKMDTMMDIQWIKNIVPGHPNVGKTLKFKSDIFGNLYVAGQYQDSLTIGGQTLYADTWTDYAGFIAKFNNQGNFLWVKEIKSYWGGNVLGIAVGTEALYLCGGGNDSLIIGTDTLQYTWNNQLGGPYIAKFDLNGNGIWGRAAQGKFGTAAWGIALNSDQSEVWLTGGIRDSMTFDSYLVTSSQIQDPFLAQYDSAGKVLFATNISSSGTYQDQGYLVTTDPNGNAYISGTFEQTFMTGDTFPSYGGKRDIFLVKYGVELCADTSSGGVGLAAEAAEIFKIFPNPATSSVYLTFEEQPQLVQVYDFNGRLVAAFEKEQMSNSYVELDISSWTQGIYLVSVTGEDGRSVVRKLVKME